MTRGMWTALAALATLTTVLTGCVSATVVQTGEATYTARSKDHPIDIYLPEDAPVKVIKAAKTPKTPNQVPAGAKIIGRMDVDGDEDASWSQVISRAQHEARKLGGDAILFQGAGTPMTGSSGVGVPIAGTSISWFGASASYGKTITVAVLRYPAPTAAPGDGSSP